ncbi:DEAD/DEAH box helicase [Microbacterium sp.]|uniref:DEAD/DEAH box helicase n=1 Tax=Microbacterium sp. TaxID=51671 RepID=UPI00373618E4
MTRIQDAVFGSKRFTAAVRALRRQAVLDEFPSIADDRAEREIPDWNFLLSHASALTGSSSERAQKTVLRIAASCLQDADAAYAHKIAASAILGRVGNHRSVELAVERDHIGADAIRHLPPLMQLEAIHARLSHTLPLSTGEDLAVNSFQDEFWHVAQRNDWVSVSAPTSAGKSRIVREWFLERLRNVDRFTGVYLAPTRALVEEVAAEFRAAAPEGTAVVAMPWDPDLERYARRVVVVTQERLHLIQQAHHPFVIDLLFIDEAQGLGSANRGVLLRQVLDRAVADHVAMQTMFASPLSSNPELLLSGHPDGSRAEALLSEAVTVNQNLLRVESVHRKPLERTVTLIHEGEPLPLGSFTLERRAPRVPMRLAFVARAMGGTGGGNVVYVNDAHNAEVVAQNIADTLPVVTGDDEVADLLELIRTAVHPKYALVDVLKHGVAFHYGNMPLMIRSEIERLFGQGKIQYLICTSTLLEGVNLPCRNIFMRNPQKGRGKPLSEADFWNLAGRAGRWGKEFQGNIVCVDTDDNELWPNLPLSRRRGELKLATERGLRDATPLLEYIRSGFVVTDQNNPSEALFSYLAARQASGHSVGNELTLVTDDDDRLELQKAITAETTDIEYPVDFIPRHSGIAPAAMSRLLDSFRADGLPPGDYALPLPEATNARDDLQAALVRIGATMTTAFGRPTASSMDDKRKWQLANLLVNWMSGMQLRSLIEQRAKRRDSLASAIREVMADIETVARFLAPKYLSCYQDVLAAYAAERGVQVTDARIDFPMMLELGVSRPSEVVLMSMGLSRTATVALAAYVTADDWTTDECLAWLTAQNLEGFDLPKLIQREVQEIRDSFARRTPARKRTH